MSMPTRLSSYIDRCGASYELCAHEPSHTSAETARSAHVLPHQLAKPVILEDDMGCVMAVVPADKSVAVDEVAQMLGRKDLRLSHEDRIARLFEDCARGAVPPVGMAWGLETVVDEELDENDVVYLEGGDHELLLRMPHEEFHRLMHDARHGRICTPTVH